MAIQHLRSPRVYAHSDRGKAADAVVEHFLRYPQLLDTKLVMTTPTEGFLAPVAKRNVSRGTELLVLVLKACNQTGQHPTRLFPRLAARAAHRFTRQRH